MRQATLLDSLLVGALLACRPARRAAVVALLAGSDPFSPPNFGHIESLAPLLAQSGGETFEALLWLFRSQRLHERVLQALAGYRTGSVGESVSERAAGNREPGPDHCLLSLC